MVIYWYCVFVSNTFTCLSCGFLVFKSSDHKLELHAIYIKKVKYENKSNIVGIYKGVHVTS